VSERKAVSLFWGTWGDYEKVRIGTREYAMIGDRLYTRHAVDYFRPRGRRTIASVPSAPGEGGGALSTGRNISPTNVEFTILYGSKRYEWREGIRRTVHKSSEIEVVTEQDDKIVVTISYRHEAPPLVLSGPLTSCSRPTRIRDTPNRSTPADTYTLLFRRAAHTPPTA
jgi:hypothetical protein